MPKINLYHGDSLKAMKEMPDNAYELAIVDPEYFSGPEKKKYYGQKVSSKGVKRHEYHVPDKWEVPESIYFDELFRVSQNQIIWGVNYFNNYSFGPGRIIWDKCNQHSTYSDCEIAYTNMHDSVRLIRYMWNGMCQGKSISEGHIMQGNKKLNEPRIHQCQKPIILYKWQLKKYAKSGWDILDTHGGSRTLAHACLDLGFNHDSWELDAKTHRKSVKWFTEYQSMMQIQYK